MKIGRDVQGAAGANSGFINCEDNNLSVTLGGSLIGGSITGSAATIYTGHIEAFGRIGSVVIGGSIISGTDTSSGALEFSGSIRAEDDIGVGDVNITAKIASITIKGIVGGTASTTDHFGFSAQQIDSFKSLNYTAPLTTPAEEAIELSPTTDASPSARPDFSKTYPANGTRPSRLCGRRASCLPRAFSASWEACWPHRQDACVPLARICRIGSMNIEALESASRSP